MKNEEYQNGLKYLKFRIQETRAHLADNEREIIRLTEEQRPHFEDELKRYEDKLRDFFDKHSRQTDIQITRLRS